jgi:hypothetical protein
VLKVFKNLRMKRSFLLVALTMFETPRMSARGFYARAAAPAEVAGRGWPAAGRTRCAPLALTGRRGEAMEH